MSRYQLLFSAPMIRALQAGKKTQTRRMIKPQPDSFRGANGIEFDMPGWCVCIGPEKFARYYSPYGQPGDRVWVRENVYIAPPDFCSPGDCTHKDTEGRPRLVTYAADMDTDAVQAAKGYGIKLTPSILMPRWCSRFSLDLEEVRTEQLQEISEEDAIREGCASKGEFEQLWGSLHGVKSWELNPWLWVLTFRKVEP